MVRYKGRDQIEYGHKPYTESSYGVTPAGAETLYRIGYIQEIIPQYDPEYNTLFTLREGAEAGRPLATLRRRENVKLRIKWLQGQLGDYYQKYLLGGYNFYGEAKLYKSPTEQLYFYWSGLKLDVLTVSCSIGEPVTWQAELVAKSVDTKDTTLHSYGANPGTVWEWSDTYLQISTNGVDWVTIPDVTDWELRVDQSLKPNYAFNTSGSKQLQSLEEMEQHTDARLTMNLPSDTYLSYLLDDTQLYLRLVLPHSQHMQISKGKLRQVDPVLKPEDLIACRLEFTGGYLEHSFT